MPAAATPIRGHQLSREQAIDLLDESIEELNKAIERVNSAYGRLMCTEGFIVPSRISDYHEDALRAVRRFGQNLRLAQLVV